MTGFSDSLGVHATALTLRSQRNDILASNIANAATPNYKARDIDFDALLTSAIAEGEMTTTHKDHLSSASSAQGVLYRQPVSAALDGNTVELGVEQMQFSENVSGYQASLSFLNQRIAGLMSAIKGE